MKSLAGMMYEGRCRTDCVSERDGVLTGVTMSLKSGLAID
jgi:hypothetical protein